MKGIENRKNRDIRGKGPALRARSRKKARAALALAVSLWMANGAFWAPGVASAEQETEVTITSTADAEAKATAETLGKKAASLLPYNSYFLKTHTKMKITGGDCKNANFFAGYSDSEAGTAEANVSGYTLTVVSGTFDATTELAGGYSFNGTANNNSVYINGGEGGASVFGSRGEVGASGNTVDMTGGTFGLVRCAYTYDGDATRNTVTISGGTVDRVFGGESHAGSATGNSVTVSGGTIGKGVFGDGVYGGRVYGTIDSAGVAENNTVTVSGGTIDGSVYGGSVGSESNPVAAATGNTVKISETDTAAPTTIKKEVYGGYSQYNAANKNVITISGGAIGTDDTNNIYGGYGYTGTSENKVTISGGKMSGQVYGGYTGATGAANKNVLEISGGTVNSSVYGGMGGTEATGNTVTISATDTAAPTTIKKEVYGGYSQYNAADKNVLEISGGTVNSSVYGGMGGTEATGNTVTISGGAIGTGDTNNIYGGRGNTDASENKVTISGGTMSGQVYGGYTGATGTANKNVLKISGGTVNSSVTGGYVDSLDAAATAEGNTVTIEGGTVNGDVNGGVAGSATGNKVTISGGTIKKSVYGGMGGTEATGNTVTISGGTVGNNIYGGYSSKGKATGNTVKISVANFEAGRICVGDGATSTGNKLVLDAKGIDVHSDVGGVQTIALTKNVKFEDNTTVLKAGKFAIDNSAATNFDGTLDISAASFAGDGAMTLLEVTSGDEEDNLATMTVAYTDGKGQAQTGTLTVDTPVRIKAGKENDTSAQNNVTLTYDSDVQQVAMKDAGQKVVLESGINGSVKDVAMGTVQWKKGSTAMDAAGAGFTLDGKTTLTDNLSIDFADAEKDAAVNDTMTLLAANQEMATLSDDFKNFSRTIEKEYSVDTAGVSIDAKVTATATASGKSLTAAITANRATKLTFGDVLWKDSGALLDHKTALTNISFEGAEVDTAKISFTNVSKLDDDAKMTLVSGFGTKAGKITGSDFTLGTLTGKGHAYWENNDLLYLVTEGAGGDTPTPTPGEDVSGETKTVEPGETVTKDDVVAAEATGSETATSNTATVSKGGTVGTKEKPLNVVGATTESGAAKENVANITGGTVYGDVAGATTVSGDAAGNTATVTDGSVIVGSDPEEKPALVGAMTESGKAEENKATVTGGTVTGDVAGAVSGTGIVSSNTATVSGKSEVTGTVVGASAKTGKLAKGNSAEVSGRSTVTGNVAGAEASKGDVSKNSASISEKSIVKGDVIGAATESGAAVANAVTVIGGSEIKKNDPESGEAKDKEVAGGDVIGATTESGTASQNTVTVTESIVERDVSGASSTSGEVNTNTVTISGGEIGGSVSGGRTEGTKGAVCNGVVLKEGAEVKGDVYGGMSDGGAADRNTVEISGEETVVTGNVFGASSKTLSTGNSVTMKDGTVGGKDDTVGGYVFGAVSKAATANNSVTMTGGVVNGLVGGGCETATENYVSVEDGIVQQFAVGGLASKTATGNTVTMTGGSVDNGIYGGYGETGAANKNHVYLGGGTVSGISPYGPVTVDGFTLKDGGVYGGYSVSGATQDNSVTLYAAADVSKANLWGGNREATGNALHIGWVAEDGTPIPWKGGENGPKVKSISNFETVSFDVVQWNTDTPALVVGEGTSELSGTVSAKNVIFTGVDKLDTKDVMTLVKNLPATAKVDEASAFTIGSLIEGTGTLSLDGDGNVIYTVKDVTSGEKAHSAVMGLEAGMAALSVGNDFIGDATAGLGLPANEGADGVSTFAKLGGGKLRQTTGSHVDVNTWNAIIAIGKKNQGEKSSFEYGAFFEYGSGNYTTHNGDERGDGSARYTGGGLLAKWKQAGGLYVEGSLRAGTVKDDAKNVLRDGAGVPYSYDTNAGYFGAHIGVGREIGLKGGNSLDVYGKYFYNRRNGVSFDAGGHYDLDAVTSSVLRVGARYTMKREAWNFYGGLAYEYEMDGEAKGKAGGLPIRGADIGGGSARLELGATMTPAKSPWTLDLNLTGFAGKKRGLMGGVSVGFMF